MATLDILYEGYVQEGDNAEIVRNTVCIIRDGNMLMIVDPGLIDPSTALLEALNKKGIKQEDITHVYVTHYHMDHVRHVGLFSHANIIDYKFTYKGEAWGEHEGDGYKITDDITIMHTPGHTMDDSALLVRTSEGLMAISHVWWFPDRTPIEDPMATDQALLEESRKRVEAIADYIVTPHGGILKVKN